MKSSAFKLKINLALIFLAVFMIFSGMLIQIEYHMGNHSGIPTDKTVFGLNYAGWSTIHKISIVLLSLIMIFHIYLHWRWYGIVIKKRLFSKNLQVLILTILFLLVAITGLTPWIIHLTEGNMPVRKAFIEIHDKLSLLLLVFLTIHIYRRMNWYILAYRKSISPQTKRNNEKMEYQ